MPLTEAERKLRASQAVLTSWANTADPTARTAPARTKFRAKFELQVDPDGKLDPAERARRADFAYRAHMKGLALKSAQARRVRAGQADGEQVAS